MLQLKKNVGLTCKFNYTENIVNFRIVPFKAQHLFRLKGRIIINLERLKTVLSKLKIKTYLTDWEKF